MSSPEFPAYGEASSLQVPGGLLEREYGPWYPSVNWSSANLADMPSKLAIISKMATRNSQGHLANECLDFSPPILLWVIGDSYLPALPAAPGKGEICRVYCFGLNLRSGAGEMCGLIVKNTRIRVPSTHMTV